MLGLGSHRQRPKWAAFPGASIDFDWAAGKVYGPRTNYIRNSSMQGAVAGTPGTQPTNWSVSTGSGISTQIVGTGTEAGVDYIDCRFFGTASGTTTIFQSFEVNNNIAAAQGQAWAGSCYAKTVSGSWPRTPYLFLTERDAAGTYITGLSFGQSTMTGATFARATTPRTIASATAAFVRLGWQCDLQAGDAIDVVLRLGGPQLERALEATPYIRTTTAAVTVTDGLGSIASVVSCTRASAQNDWAECKDGTFKSFAANTPRITDMGLWSEGSRTNALTYSHDLSNAAWSKNATTVDATGVAGPFGVNALGLVEDVVNTTHGMNSALWTTAIGTSETLSCIAKAGLRSTLRFFVDGNGGTTPFAIGSVGCHFDLATGTVSSLTNVSASAASIRHLGNGWYFCALTITPDQVTTTARWTCRWQAATTGTASFAGDTSATAGYFAHLQRETGAYATSPIRTAGAAATRAADFNSSVYPALISLLRVSPFTIRTAMKHGAGLVNIGPWFTAKLTAGGVQRIDDRSRGAPNEMYMATGGYGITSAALSYVSISSGTPFAPNTRSVVVNRHRDTTVAGSQNGGSVGFATPAGGLKVDDIDFTAFGCTPSGGTQFAGAIERTTFYGDKTDTELLALSV